MIVITPHPNPTSLGPATTAPPRPSATVVLMRDSEQGPEVLLLRRGDRGDQNSNAWVFPGGLIDASDELVHAHCTGLSPELANQRLDMADNALNYWVAAVRETLEEAGLLLAVDAQGQAVGGGHEATLAAWRALGPDIARGQAGASLARLLAEQGWRISINELLPISHWITPRGMPKRYDTWFLLARAPEGQTVSVDGGETVEHRWMRPADALQDVHELKLAGPTRATLQELQAHGRVADALAWAQARQGHIDAIQPRLARNAQGRINPVLPVHPAYAEIGWIDPLGEGLARYELAPDVAQMPGPDLVRITAANGSIMTGPGTNSYLLRCGGTEGQTQWVLIDPGPDDAAHVQAIMTTLQDTLKGTLVAMVVTHTHIDHSPASRAVQALTQAPIYGRVADHAQGQDPHFAPDRVLHDGETLTLGETLRLEVIHTPGHASNHLCFYWPAQRMLFTGDHVMQGSTVVINPPDGHMAAYLGSLVRLASRATHADAGFDWIAPGHGFLMPQPERVLQTLIRHRQRRDAKVHAALTELNQTAPVVPMDALLARVYDDVPVQRHGVARRSLLAHLHYLQEQGRARPVDDGWQAV